MSAEPNDAPRSTGDLVPVVYEELRAIAHAYFRNQPPSFTLRPTEVVHEACLHLLRHGHPAWDSPQHFRAIATHKIWQVIIDHLKSRHAQKRGGAGIPKRSAPANAADKEGRPSAARRVPLATVNVEWGDQTVDLLDLADALEDLAAESRRLRDIVMLHWFGGLPHADVGRALEISASTAEKDFRYALAWLNRRLTQGAPGGD